MNAKPEDHLDAYFTGRSHEIPAPTTPTSAIVARGRRRRHRRTAARLGAGVAVLALAGGIVAGGRSGKPAQEVGSYGAVVPSTLDWTTVTPKQGIGWISDTATTGDGAIYDLSTAPGNPADERTPTGTRLYRSGDGREWTSVALPTGLRASAVAADAGSLYAVGTAPAGGGGGEQVDVATSTSGGSTWDRAHLPLDVAALAEGFPGDVEIGRTEMASVGGRTVVAVGVQGQIDPAQLHTDGLAATDPIRVVPTGIDLLDGACTKVPKVDPAAVRACKEDPNANDAVKRHWTWSELGLDPSVGALTSGRTILFQRASGGAFDQVGELPPGIGAVRLLGGSDGFWASYETIAEDGNGQSWVLHSSDGRAWTTTDAVRLPGSPVSLGILDGRPVAAVAVEHGFSPSGSDRAAVPTDLGSSLQLLVLGSGEPVVDVTAALGDAYRSSRVRDVSFGPLGMAAILDTQVSSPDGGGIVTSHLVHASSLTSFSEIDIPKALAGQRETVNGVTVSADAVTVRLNSYPADNPTDGKGLTPTQRLYVGTPR